MLSLKSFPIKTKEQFLDSLGDIETNLMSEIRDAEVELRLDDSIQPQASLTIQNLFQKYIIDILSYDSKIELESLDSSDESSVNKDLINLEPAELAISFILIKEFINKSLIEIKTKLIRIS